MKPVFKFGTAIYSNNYFYILSLVLMLSIALTLFYACTGKSIKNTQDLKKVLSEVETPNDPNLFDEKLCNYATSYAKNKGYNSPACLYTNAAGEIKAKPGGAISLTPLDEKTGIAEVIVIMVNTGTKPIAIGNQMLNKGEVALYDFKQIRKTGTVLQLAK